MFVTFNFDQALQHLKNSPIVILAGLLVLLLSSLITISAAQTND